MCSKSGADSCYSHWDHAGGNKQIVRRALAYKKSRKGGGGGVEQKTANVLL